MRSHALFTLWVALGLLTGCAHLDPHPMDMTNAIRSAKTRADHDALARHYEAAADAMRAKAQEQKTSLAEYRSHSAYYGRAAEDLKAHAQALVRVYEEAAEANMTMSKSHRYMAREMK